MKQNKGITLVALIITIIVMIILAAITINLTLGKNGLFAKIERTKIEKARADLEEELQLIYSDDTVVNEGSTKTLPEFATLLQDKGYDITEEEQYYINKDKYQFLLAFVDDKISVSYVGEVGNMSPSVNSLSFETTTSSIKVTASVSNLGEGTLSYYYKKSTDFNYIEYAKNQSSLECTISGLETNLRYDIKVVAKNLRGLTGEKEGAAETVSLDNIAVGNISFSEPTWNNRKVTITASTLVEGYTLQTSKDAENWSDNSTVSDITVGTGTTVYARLWDGHNGSSPASIELTDTTEPTAGLTLENATTSGFKMKANGLDSQTGIVKYEFYINGNLYYTKNSTASEEECNVINQEASNSYSCYVVVTDGSGKTAQSEMKRIDTLSMPITSASTSFENMIEWKTDEKAYFVATTTTDGYTLQVSSDGKNWTPTTVNTSVKSRVVSTTGNTVYARLWDGYNGSSNVSKTIPFTLDNNKKQYLPFQIYAGGSGTSSSPFEIANAKQLRYFAMQVNTNTGTDKYVGNYNLKLIDNIDLSEYTSSGTARTKKWIPIGYYNSDNDMKGFIGNFDGNNKTIDNIYVNSTNLGAGLFCLISQNATLQNIILSSGAINGTGNCGAICGASYNISDNKDTNPIIINCKNYANVVASGDSIGGIEGICSVGKVQKCHNYVRISGAYRVGGIVGQFGSNNIIDKCSNNGEIYANSANQSGDSFVGGIVGWQNSGTVQQCVNKGYIYSNNNTIGGIAGGSRSVIKDCYNIGTVGNSNYRKNMVGGIIGNLSNTSGNGNVSNVYSVGNIYGSTYVGGIIGYQQSGTNLSNCYPQGTLVDGASNDYGAASTYKGYIIGNKLGNISGYYTNQCFANLPTTDLATYFPNGSGGSNFKTVSGKNNNYPVLNWE